MPVIIVKIVEYPTWPGDADEFSLLLGLQVETYCLNVARVTSRRENLHRHNNT